MVEICSLASGSNGNCYYIGNQENGIIIDDGIYYKRLVERCEVANIPLEKIRAVFVSHEHADHVRGVRVLNKRTNIPAYFTSKTYYQTFKKDRPANFCELIPGEVVDIFGIKVHCFSKHHDAKDPVSFRIEINGLNIGVMTDIGVADEILQYEFSKCQAVFLESNYDEEMLKNGSYPYYLKERVASEVGHLSNTQAFELVRDFANENLSHLIFSHISAENNTKEKVLEKFEPFKDKYKMYVAPRYECGEVIKLSD